MTEEQKQLCEDCANRDRKMTEWEQDFIDGLMRRDPTLSPKQEETLNNIWEKVTA